MPDETGLAARKAAADAIEGARTELRALLVALPDVGSGESEAVSGARSTLNFCLGALDAEAADMARVASQDVQPEPVAQPEPAPAPESRSDETHAVESPVPDAAPNEAAGQEG